MKRIASLLLGLAMAAAALSGCGAQGRETAAQEFPDAVSIVLSDDGIIVDGKAVSTDESAAVHTAHDIVCYESGRDFTYGEGTEADEHTAEEAEAHTVVHITQPGTYALSGTLSAGQIAVDLGEDAEDDPAAVVTLILNGVDITCTVAPAVIFYNVYECGSTDEDTASETVDTSAAGANVLIADGTINNVTGSYVARIYDPDSVVLSEDGMTVEDSEKLHKYDGAFYSKMSMNVDGGEAGTGVLNITADNEGLDTELHLTINGGTINITSGNDGINTNEDNVSVTTVNGGSVNIQVTGETGEGDGIDSNGWLVINGGAVTAAACSDSGDAGIDATMGITINGGTVAASGNMYDQIDGGAQNYVVFSFASRQNGGQTYTLQNADGETVGTWTPANDFTCLVVSSPDLTAGDYTLWQGDTQLAGTMSDGVGSPGGGRHMGGEAPPADLDPWQAPEGEVPENAGSEVPDDPPDLHLGLSLVEPQGEDAPLPVIQPLHGLFQGDAVRPGLVGVPGVADLVHDADGVAAVGVYRLVQRHGIHDGVHGEDHFLPGDAQLLGDLFHRGLPLVFRQVPVPDLQDFIGRVPHGAGHPDGAVVPEISADLADDHGHAVSGKPHRLIDVKVVDGLDEPHAAHLKQVVGVLAPAGEALDDGEHQPQISLDQFPAGLLVPGLGAAQEFHGLLVFQHLQLCRVDARDLHLALHGCAPSNPETS